MDLESSGATPRPHERIAVDDSRFYIDEGRANRAFRWLRREAPLWWFEPRGFWVVSRRDDVMSMSKSPDLWSSRSGIAMPSHAGKQAPDMGQDQAPSIIQMDPPDHNRHRALVSRAFTPRRISDLESRIREIAVESIERTPIGEPIDFVESVALPLPMRVIAEMLGVPEDDLERFRRWSDAVIVQAGADAERSQGLEAIAEVFAYFARMLAERRSRPGADLLSALVSAEVEGRALEEGEILIFCMTLLVAGNETTRTLVAQGARLLLEQPDQLDALRSRAAPLPDAIEELFRLTSPIRYFFRRATRDVEMRGTTIRAGDPVMMLYTAANRDEAVWGEDADRLDVRRPVQPHVALGFGQHFCLGANLARLEARVLFEELLARRGHWESAGEVEFVRSSFVNGIERMPVVLRA